MRYFIEIGYNGVPFHGWQRQPNALSVQAVIEDALQLLTRCPTPITGAGRTDTGVHARRMYAHFDMPEPISDISSIRKSLDNMTGRHIAIRDIFQVSNDLHARFSALSRTYRYFITLERNPFLRERAWEYQGNLNVEAMNRCAALLLDVDDFTSFAKLHSDAMTNICTVQHCLWQEWKDEYGTPGLMFEIKANRFLRNMVRAVVGTLLEVGRGKINQDEFEKIVEGRNRCLAGTSVPGYGLYLWDVEYPDFN